MQNKLISNREMFRQLLARDILAILQKDNAGTWMRLSDVRQQLQHKGFNSALQHYYNLHTSKGWSYLCFNDRFYRAVQSINNKGYGIKVAKGTDNKLYVFSTQYANSTRWTEFLSELFTVWTTNYSNNTGYNINAQLDEVVA